MPALADSNGDTNIPPVFSWTAWQAVAVILLFCVALCISLFLPTLEDEIFFLMLNGRAGYDDWQSLSTFPQCNHILAVPVPFTLLPGRALSWAMHFIISDPYALRMSGITILLSWIAYMAWFLKQCIIPSEPWLIILAGILGFISLGTLPFAMALARPETGMALAVTLYVSVPFLVDKYPAPARWIIWLSSLLFILVTSWFLSAHPKAIFYAPLLLMSAIYACKWHKAVGGALTALTVFACYQTAGFILSRLSCPDSAEIKPYLESLAVSPFLLFTNSPLFWKNIALNLMHTVYYLLEIILPLQGGWLPGHRQDFFHTNITAMGPIYSVIWLTTLILIVVVILRSLTGVAASIIVAARTAVREHSCNASLFFILPCLLAAAFAQCALQTEMLFYNFSLIWITLLLGGVITLAYLSENYTRWDRIEDKLRRGYKILLLAAFVNLCYLLLTYIPATLTLLQEPAPNGLVMKGPLLDQQSGVGSQHYGETRRHILDAAQMCHIPLDRSGHHVALDQYSYLPLKDTYQPLRIGFRFFHEFNDPQKFFAFLRKWQSSGLITPCFELPEKIRPFAKETEGVCCLSREQITPP